MLHIEERRWRASFLFAGLLLFCLAARCDAVQAEVKRLTNVSYTYSKPPSSGYKDRGDPRHTKLLNGILEDSENGMLWDKMAAGTVTVTFDLKGRHLIHKVVGRGRRTRAHSFYKMEVSLEDEASFTKVGMDDFGTEDYKKPGPAVLTVARLGKPARRLKVKCFCDSNYFWLQEVEIYGSDITPRSPMAKDGLPKPRPRTTYALPALPAGLDLFVREGDFDGDGDPEILVENNLLRLVFEPKLGGRIGSFVYKPTKQELTMRPDVGVPGGMLGDHVWQQGYWGDWVEASYQYRIVKADDAVSVRMSCPGRTGSQAFLTFNKAVMVARGSAAVKVDYEIENSFRAVVPLIFGFWFHNCAGGGWGQRHFFVPCTKGIERISIAKVPADVLARDPARGWVGTIAEDTKSGLVTTLDYRYFKQFYSWVKDLPVPTYELKFHPVKIEAGERFRTSFTWLAFSGLPSIAGAGAEVVGALEVKGGQAARHLPPGTPRRLAVSLAGARPMAPELVLRLRRLPDGRDEELGRAAVQIPAIGAVSHEFTFTPKKPGTYAAVVEVRTAGKTVCELETPLVVGKSSAPYALVPKEPQLTIGKAEPKVFDIKMNSQAVVTPHVAWAKPYAGRRVRALVFAEERGMRDIVELQQRMDLDVETSFLTHYYPEEGLGDYYRLLTHEIMVKQAQEILNKDYDVVILTGYTWDLLGDKFKAKTKEWTRKGVGIVCIDPIENSAAAWDVLPVAPGKGRAGRLAWNPAKPHPVTVGIPLGLFPTTRFIQVVPRGTVIATAGKKHIPAIVVGESGRSRVAVIAYETSVGYPRGKRMPMCSLLPDYYDQTRQSMTYDYWEYCHSLLARAILWAARAERPVELLSIEPPRTVSLSSTSGATVAIKVRSSRAATLKVVAAVHQGLRPRVFLKPTEVSLPAGEGEISLVVPTAALLDGDNLVDFWVRDEKDRTLEWGTAVVKARSPIRISELELGDKSFPKGVPVTGTVSIEAPTGRADGWLRISIVDGQGRVIWRQERKTQAGSLAFTAAPAQSVIAANRLVVEVGRGERLLARWSKYFIIPPSRAWDDFDACVWGCGAYKGVRMYTMPKVAATLREAGFTSIIMNPWDWHPDYIHAAMAEGFRLVGKGGGLGSPGAKKDSDPKHPVRTTNPIADKTLAYARNVGKSRAGTGTTYGILDFMTGDENSWGGDWAPFYIEKFRQWLKAEYGTIAALNAEWESNFEDFNAVVPLNLEDARKTGHFARWVDFKRFDAHAFAAYFATMRNATKEADPEGRLELSGTQNPGARNGHDWALLANSLDVVRSYGMYQQTLIRSLNPKAITARWTGYGRSNEGLYWWCWKMILEGGRGLSNCSERQILNPDLTLSKSGRMFSEVHRQLNRGVVKALIHAKRTHEEVLMHYSYPSHCVAALLGCERELDGTRRGFIDSLHSYGTQYRFASDGQIEAGLLQEPGYRLLVLTHSFAISDKEGAAIRRFVENGGVVLADLRPGITDEHGRRRRTGVLDDLFGVDGRRAKLSIGKTELKGSAPVAGIALGHKPVSAGAIETGLTATAAKAAGIHTETKTPVFLVNQVGKGKTILLNCNIFAEYGSLQAGRELPGYAERIRLLDHVAAAVITSAGIAPIAELTADDGGDIPYKYFARFEAGKVAYLGVLHCGTVGLPTRMASLKLSGRYNVYDVVADRATRRTDTLRFPLPGVMTKLFALTPYSVRAITAHLPDSAKAGQAVRFQVSLDADEAVGDHVIRMEVVGPDGKERWYLAQNILARAGKAQVVLPFAFNDPTGRWTVRFHDVTSGKRLTRTIALTPD